MKRFLVGLVLLELIVGTYVVYDRVIPKPVPWVPDFSRVAERDAEHVRNIANMAERGEAYMALGYFREAEMCHRIACEAQPDDPNLFYQWGFVLERLGHTGAAIEKYQLAIELKHPRAAECRYMVARNLLREEKLSEAMTELEFASTVPYANHERARYMLREQRPQEARPLIDALVREYPQAFPPRVLRYRLAYQTGDRAAIFQASEQIELARRRLPNPFDHDAQRLLDRHAKLGLAGRWREAEQRVKDRQWDHAEPLLREGLAIQWHPTGVDLLAEVEFQRGQKTTALNLLREIIDRAGPTAYHYGRLGDFHHELGQENEARAAWKLATEMGSRQEAKDNHYKRALSFEKAKDTTAHKESFAQALLCAADEQYHQGNLSDADQLLTQALQQQPKLAEAWFLRGEIARQRQQREQALAHYQQCLSLQSHHGQAITAMEFLRLRP